jgi:hypothetical protein
VNGPRVVAAGKEPAVAWFTEAGGKPRVLVKRGDAEPVVISETAIGRVDLIARGDDLYVSWMEASGEIRLQRLGGTPTAVAKVSPQRASGMPRMGAMKDGILIAWTDPEAKRVRTSRIPWDR